MQQVRDAGLDRGGEQALRGEHVARHVGLELLPTAQQPGHGGEVEDRVRAGEQRTQVCAAQVGFVEGEALLLAQGGEIAFLERARVVGDEVVDAGDAVSAGDELFAEVLADETVGAGDDAMCHRSPHGLPDAVRPLLR